MSRSRFAQAKLLSEDAIRQAEDCLRVLRQEEAAGGVQESNQPRFQPISHRSWRSYGILCRNCKREKDELRMELAGRPQECAVRDE